MKTRLSLLAGVLSLALIAAACGGGSEEQTETTSQGAAAGGVVTLQGGKEFKSILLPKFTGVAVFDQDNQGAQEAAK
jgi:ABC-type glycerol-3-phosphate transport system substrate-binding protein